MQLNTGNDVRGWSIVGDYLEASIFIGVACVDLLLRIELQLSLTDLDDEKELRKLLGTGMDTQDASPSMLLFFDKQRFIFNAGERLQRFCTEHKIKLSKEKWRFKERSYGFDKGLGFRVYYL
ncbi:unnamed protein product [Prunus armeniaca]